MKRQNRLIWIDLEMTGLNPENNVIIEIATLVTDEQLEEVAVGPVFAIKQSEDELAKMDQWNTNQHGKSGLTERVRSSDTNSNQAEQQTLTFLQQHVEAGTSPMCGNSICLDRRFLVRYMPTLEAYFHYRHLDVSSLKILAQMWAPELEKALNKTSDHLALSDIRDSIEELRFYRQHLLANTGAGK